MQILTRSLDSPRLCLLFAALPLTLTISACADRGHSPSHSPAGSPPLNEGVTPDKGRVAGGETVTIASAKFRTGDLGFTAYFGNKKASCLSAEAGPEKIEAHSEVQLRCITPAGLVGETVDVVVVFDDSRSYRFSRAFTFY